jgi:hypothetical protein
MPPPTRSRAQPCEDRTATIISFLGVANRDKLSGYPSGPLRTCFTTVCLECMFYHHHCVWNRGQTLCTSRGLRRRGSKHNRLTANYGIDPHAGIRDRRPLDGVRFLMKQLKWFVGLVHCHCMRHSNCYTTEQPIARQQPAQHQQFQYEVADLFGASLGGSDESCVTMGEQLTSRLLE